MGNGYLKLHRPLFDHALWQDRPFSRGQAWIDLIGLAAFTDHHVTPAVKIKRGQVRTTTRYLCRRWGWGKGRVERFLRYLTDESMITLKQTRQRGTGGSLITIGNYSLYQDPKRGTGGAQNRPQSGAQTKGHESIDSHRGKGSLFDDEDDASGAESGAQSGAIRKKVVRKNTSSPSEGNGDNKPRKRPGSRKAKAGYDAVAIWCQEYKRRHGVNPEVLPATAKQAYTLAEAMPESRFRDIVRLFLQDQTQWIIDRGYPLSALPDRINRYTQELHEAKLDAESKPKPTGGLSMIGDLDGDA